MSPPAEAAAPAAPVAWREPAREAAFTTWAASIAPRFGLDASTLQPASSDASFRRYLRLHGGSGSLIVMDAPPPLEDVRPFVHVAGLLADAGVHAPRVLAADETHGFLLLTDLGSQLYLDAMQAARAAGSEAEADRLMRELLNALVHWQQHVRADTLPAFDAQRQHEELALFPTWCVQREHGITWSAAQQAAWQQVCDRIVASALAQPAVAVHADWMPRNLMVTPQGPGVLDFQDAVRGAITYDLASLLRDAFVSWPEEQQLDWAVRWWQAARKAGLPVDEDFGEFWRALEWMGLQRHLRILGVFCRLKHRDGKPHYSQDLPRFFGYATKVAMRYRPLASLLPLLEPMSGAAVAAGFTF
jgi:N-acetylmuramate 1-kinase